jgi:hypothetical protein
MIGAYDKRGEPRALCLHGQGVIQNESTNQRVDEGRMSK